MKWISLATGSFVMMGKYALPLRTRLIWQVQAEDQEYSYGSGMYTRQGKMLGCCCCLWRAGSGCQERLRPRADSSTTVAASGSRRSGRGRNGRRVTGDGLLEHGQRHTDAEMDMDMDSHVDIDIIVEMNCYLGTHICSLSSCLVSVLVLCLDLPVLIHRTITTLCRS